MVGSGTCCAPSAQKDWTGKVLHACPGSALLTSRTVHSLQGAAISHSLQHEQTLRLPNQALAQERLLLLQMPLKVCRVLQGPPQLLLRMFLQPERAMEQGYVRLLQQDPGQCPQKLHHPLLLRLLLLVLAWQAEEGHGAPS